MKVCPGGPAGSDGDDFFAALGSGSFLAGDDFPVASTHHALHDEREPTDRPSAP